MSVSYTELRHLDRSVFELAQTLFPIADPLPGHCIACQFFNDINMNIRRLRSTLGSEPFDFRLAVVHFV